MEQSCETREGEFDLNRPRGEVLSVYVGRTMQIFLAVMCASLLVQAWASAAAGQATVVPTSGVLGYLQAEAGALSSAQPCPRSLLRSCRYFSRANRGTNLGCTTKNSDCLLLSRIANLSKFVFIVAN